MGSSTRLVRLFFAARWMGRKQIVGLKYRRGCSTGRHALRLRFWHQHNRTCSAFCASRSGVDGSNAIEATAPQIISAAPDCFYIPLPNENGDINFEFEKLPIVGWEIDSAGQALPITTEFGRPSSSDSFAIQFPGGHLRVHDIYPQTKFDNWEAFVKAMHSFAREENISGTELFGSMS